MPVHLVIGTVPPVWDGSPTVVRRHAYGLATVFSYVRSCSTKESLGHVASHLGFMIAMASASVHPWSFMM